MPLVVTTHEDVSEFAALALPFLLRAEAENCLGLGVVETLQSEPERYPKYYLFSVHDGSQLLGVAWMTPPAPLGLSAMPRAAIEALVGHAALLPDAVSGVVGPKTASDAFKDYWLERPGTRLEVTTEQRIYRVENVRPPHGIAGELQVAGSEHLETLTEWSAAFVHDCGIRVDQAALTAATAAALRRGERSLWWVDGEPVSMADARGKTPSGMRIGYVYTPPAFRRRGYASALVAALSQKLIRAGRKFCVLYTDLANPTSNGIYQRIGYTAVCDSAHHVFAAPSP